MALQRGRIVVKEVEISDIRVLAREDLPLLLETRPPVTIQSLRDNHHRIARAMAAGLPTNEVAALCGMSNTRVSQLKADPAFKDLVAHYRGLVTAEYVRALDPYLDLATSNMLKAEAMLSDKLDAALDNNEFLPTRDLISISRDAADRFGYGKRQTNLNVNADFAAMLEAARTRSARAREVGGPTALTSSPQSAPVIDHAPALSQEPTQFRRRV